LSGKAGKPGNVREFETFQGNVRDVVNSQGNVREKILSWKSVPNCSLLGKYLCSYGYLVAVLATVYLSISISFKNSAYLHIYIVISSFVIINYEIIVNLIV